MTDQGRDATCTATRLRPCGTYAAAMRHKARGEPIDDACLEARRAWWRERMRIARSIPAYLSTERVRQREKNRLRRADDLYRRREAAQARERHRQNTAQARYDQRHCVDHVVVDRLVAGMPVTANRAERLAAVRILRVRGCDYNEIADRLGIAQRQVHRDLTDLGLIGLSAVGKNSDDTGEEVAG